MGVTQNPKKQKAVIKPAVTRADAVVIAVVVNVIVQKNIFHR